MSLRSHFKLKTDMNLSNEMKYLFGEFDPGSGRTLAACLTHASRTEILLKLAIKYLSGGRVSNAWVICP